MLFECPGQACCSNFKELACWIPSLSSKWNISWHIECARTCVLSMLQLTQKHSISWMMLLFEWKLVINALNSIQRSKKYSKVPCMKMKKKCVHHESSVFDEKHDPMRDIMNERFNLWWKSGAQRESILLSYEAPTPQVAQFVGCFIGFSRHECSPMGPESWYVSPIPPMPPV